MKLIHSAIFIASIIFFTNISYLAQENEPVVIDEVVAQINEGVITLSSINRELKEFENALVQQGSKTQQAAKAEVESKKGELIANLINEELILQRGKEIGVDQQVDAEINQRFLQIMKEQNIKTLEALYTNLRAQNYNVDEIRENWRRQITKDLVIQREVDGKIYWSLSGNDLRKYWESNKSKFTKPEKITLSEIFLNYAGRDEKVVLETAKKIVDELKKGGDFEKLALQYSDRPEVKDNKGKVGTFPVSELNEAILTPLKTTKVGSITDPILVDGGIEIFRVDAREAASNESVFDEDAVRKAMTMEKLPEERKKYLAELRKDAYIELSESYRALVLPHLNKDENSVSNSAKKPGK